MRQVSCEPKPSVARYMWETIQHEQRLSSWTCEELKTLAQWPGRSKLPSHFITGKNWLVVSSWWNWTIDFFGYPSFTELYFPCTQLLLQLPTLLQSLFHAWLPNALYFLPPATKISFQIGNSRSPNKIYTSYSLSLATNQQKMNRAKIPNVLTRQHSDSAGMRKPSTQ